MSAAIVGTSPGALIRPREKFRGTWGLTPGAATLEAVTLGLFRQDLATGMQRLFSEGLTATGLAYPVSQPAVAPGDLAATMDFRITTTAPGNTTVAALARKLDELAGGFRYELLRLAFVPEGESAAAAQAARDQITAAESGAVEASAPHESFLGGLQTTYKTAVYIMAGGVALYLLVETGTLRKAFAK